MENATHYRLAEALKRAGERQKSPKDRTNKGYLYAIRCHDFVKIGTATNPYSRITNLQIGNPYMLKTIALFKVANMLMAEQLIHKYLDPFHHRGEWFMPPNDVVVAIYKMSFEQLTNFLEKRDYLDKTAA